MASPDKNTSPKFNLESPDRTRPAWSERIKTNGSPERSQPVWSSSQTNGGSPETTRSSWSKSQSKIENPEKTRSNWSRAIQSTDANNEQDQAVRIIIILKIITKDHVDTTLLILSIFSNPNILILLHVVPKKTIVVAFDFLHVTIFQNL